MKQVGVFLHTSRADLDYMLASNGNVIVHPTEATIEYNRNGIWYLKITFPMSDIHNNEIPNEAMFKVNLPFADSQLFQTIYITQDKVARTYTCYCNQVFFDCQKEVVVFDNRTINSNWTGAIDTANEIIGENTAKNSYHIYGQLDGQTTTAYWVDYNLIECIFGTGDNSLVNRWTSDMSTYHPCAMFNNYDCYFGDSQYYPDYLKPTTQYIPKECMTKREKTVSMENVTTAIVPKSYNGHMLPNHEIVKSSLWDSYRIHRIEFKTYEDIKLKDDASDDEKDTAYSTLAELYVALRNVAKQDLESLMNPVTTYSVNLVNSSVSTNLRKDIKLNDTIKAIDDTGELTGLEFYIEKMTYNLVTEYAESLEIKYIGA